MSTAAYAATLRALLAALREDLKPELTSANGKLRAELMDMLLSRLSVEAEGGADTDAPLAGAPPRTLAEVADFVRVERDRRLAVETAVAHAASAKPAGHRSGGELSIPPQRFTDYLRRRFPDDLDIRCLSLETVPGGRSKGTILVEVEGRSTPASIVLRRDFELSVTGTSVAYEYPIIKAAHEAGICAPPPLWLETDASAIGGPFIAFEKVAGRSQGDLFNTTATPGIVRDLAAVLARLHAVDIGPIADKLDFGRDANPVRAMLEKLHARYRTHSVHLPILDAAFTWLWLRLDAIGIRRDLIHGDAAMHNLMGENDRLTALLDWEFAHAGDPAEDLTYCKVLAEKVIPWDEFMAVYKASGGEAVSAERMQFFTVYRSLQLAVSAAVARKFFETGSDQDLRLAAIGYNSLPRHLTMLAGNLADASGSET